MHVLMIAWGGICMLGTCQEIVPVNIGDVMWPAIALILALCCAVRFSTAA